MATQTVGNSMADNVSIHRLKWNESYVTGFREEGTLSGHVLMPDGSVLSGSSATLTHELPVTYKGEVFDEQLLIDLLDRLTFSGGCDE